VNCVDGWVDHRAEWSFALRDSHCCVVRALIASPKSFLSLGKIDVGDAETLTEYYTVYLVMFRITPRFCLLILIIIEMGYL
jgi:hypothetical protein